MIIFVEILFIKVYKRMKTKLLFTLFAGAAAMLSTSCNAQKGAESATDRDSTYTTLMQPEWSRNAVIYEVNLRQYTPSASVKEFATHLPRLKELGVDILWFMPIHPISEVNRKGELGSYYAVQDYKKLNPEFGVIEDFKALVDQAHEMGMKVILDGVYSHTGSDSLYFNRYGNFPGKGAYSGPESPYYDWYTFYQFLLMSVIVAVLWLPKRKEQPFHWSWAIPLISLFLSAADVAYLFALSDGDAMISVVSMIRRSSVLVSFACGAIIFHEQNLKAKAIDLALIFIGAILLYIGSR